MARQRRRRKIRPERFGDEGKEAELHNTVTQPENAEEILRELEREAGFQIIPEERAEEEEEIELEPPPSPPSPEEQ